MNQDVRFADFAGVNNPLAIFDAYKPPRFMFDARVPTSADGENYWVFINTLTGDLYLKNDTWSLKYNIGGGSIPGGVSSASNVGAGYEVFKQLAGVDLEFRTFSSLDGSVYITQSGDVIDLQVPDPTGFIVSAASIGSGVPVYKEQVADQLRFRSIIGDVNIGVALSGDNVAISLLNVPTIKNAISVGTGVPVLSGISGTDLWIKSIKNSTGRITVLNNAFDLDLGVNIDKVDVGLNFIQNVSNFYGTTTPTVNSDIIAGYIVGSLWSAVIGDELLYVCTDNSTGAAVWKIIYDSGTPYPIVYEKDFA